MSMQVVENKQKYLRINIMEAGYNPSDFVEYLESQKGKQIN